MQQEDAITLGLLAGALDTFKCALAQHQGDEPTCIVAYCGSCGIMSGMRTALPSSDLLILSAQTGGGHMSLATALQELLAPYATAAIAEPLPQLIAAYYRWMSRHARWLWAAGYSLTDTPPRALALHQFLARLFAPAIDKLLRKRRYRLVITTYPFLSYEVKRAIDRLPRPVPFIALFADPERVHHAWLTERHTDATLAPTHETYMQALKAGFAPDRLHLTGWPVRRQFCDAELPLRAATLGRLCLDPDRFTVFVQGGGEGSAGFAQCVTALLLAGTPQIILAVGTNQGLGERFRGAPGVRVIPYTSMIAPLMASADLVIGKAGPNTLIESTMLGKPFIATTYIPGQEEGNLTFIQRHGLGWVALDMREQRQLIERLKTTPTQIAEMSASVGRYRAWNAAATELISTVVSAAI
jgi:UDP-N-acetylglucosamine:LPS N-acetylglucosamine transferase